MLSTNNSQWWWTCELIYVLSNLFMKLSVGLFLLRIAVYRSQRIALWFVNVVTVIISLYFFLLFVFQCWPVSYFWEQYEGMEGRCLSIKTITDSTYAYSVISCWADWTFCILPVAMVWRLQLNIRTKISVILILGLSTMSVSHYFPSSYPLHILPVAPLPFAVYVPPVANLEPVPRS
jgi:hypothetical protein